MKLGALKGVDEAYEAKFVEAGVSSVEGLLEACATKKGRTELAGKTGIDEKLILRWANHADLFRVKGIAGQYSDLLEAAGVDSVPELAMRNASNLFKKIQEVNDAEKIVVKMPTEAQVEDWVKQASELPRVLQH